MKFSEAQEEEVRLRVEGALSEFIVLFDSTKMDETENCDCFCVFSAVYNRSK